MIVIEKIYCIGIIDRPMFFIPDDSLSGHCFWRDRAQYHDCPYRFFRLYAGGEDRAFNRLFLWSAGGYLLCQRDRVLCTSLHVYRLYERQVRGHFLSAGHQTAGGSDPVQ